MSSSIGVSGCRRLALHPARAVVGARVGAVVGLAGDVQPQLLEHLAVLGGLDPERGQEVAHHHAVQAGLDGERLQLAEVLDAAAAEAEEGVGQDQAEDRDPLDDLPGIHQLAVAELGAGARVEQVDRDRVGIDLGQLEGHLDPLALGLAEVEDAADAALQPGLLDRVDRADAALVADRGRDLGVVGAARSRRCGGRAGCPASFSCLARSDRHVADRGAALEVGLLADELGALDDLREVPLRQPLALGDHAEAVGAGGLGGLGVLEDLLGLHHRVHRGVGLGVARLGAEAAVLGAAAGLGVDQRAHVGGVAEAVGAHLPRRARPARRSRRGR